MSLAPAARRLVVVLAFLAACAASFAAEAARTFTVVQSPATVPLPKYPMRTTQALSYTITNTSTGGNAGERIYRCRFRINNGSTFANATAAPAGWTRTAYSTTSVTFQATSWANSIAVGGPATAFTLQILMTSAAADANQTLRDVRCNFTLTTTGPPFGNTGNPTVGGGGAGVSGWTITSLQITSFVITDLAGTPVTAITAGTSFRLVMTVLNQSTATQNPIASNPNPPTPTKTGTVTQTLTGTVGSPLNLASGASGTITFTYSTVATDIGTIFFTASAQRSATVTSPTATSPSLAVSAFTAALASSRSCQYAGSNITITMTLVNGYPYSITNITPTLTPVAGAPVTLVSGPTPATVATLAAGANTNITWTYQVNSVGATNPFTFSGSATGTANTVGNPPVTTPTAISASITRGDFAGTISPTAVNASSTNVEMTVTITNNGCAAVNSVAITPPGGWAASADTYSVVTLAAGPVETWTVAGTTFTSPNAANQMPVAFGGDFAVVFSSTPVATGAGTFTVRVTDANGLFADVPLGITVSAYLSGTLNNADTRAWREDFR